MGKIQTFNTKYGVGSWQKSNKQSRLPIFLIMLIVTLVITNTTAQQNIFIAPQVQSTQGGHTNVNNFALDFTIGEPVQTSLQSGNLMLTQGFEQMEKPLPPVAPVAQAVCSDTAVTFVFEDMIAGTGADQLEWSLHSNFDTSYLIPNYGSISLKVDTNQIDTVWMRSKVNVTGCVSQIIYTTGQIVDEFSAGLNPIDTTVEAWQRVVFNANGGVTYSWVGLPYTSPSLEVTALKDSISYQVVVLNGTCKDTLNAIVRAEPNLLETIVMNLLLSSGGDSTLTACQTDTFMLQIANADSMTHSFAVEFEFDSSALATNFELLNGSYFTDTIIGNKVYLVTTNFPAITADTIMYVFHTPCSLIPPSGTLSALRQIIGITGDSLNNSFSGDYSINGYVNSFDTLNIPFHYPVVARQTSGHVAVSLATGQDGVASWSYTNSNSTADFNGTVIISMTGTLCSDTAIEIVAMSVLAGSDTVAKVPYPTFPDTFSISQRINTLLKFQLKLKRHDCGECHPHFSLQWGCNEDVCRSTPDKVVDISQPLTNRPYVVVSRVTPIASSPNVADFQFAWDGSCFKTETQWEFLVANRGDAAAKDVVLNLTSILGTYTYIREGTIEIDTNDIRFPNAQGVVVDSITVTLLDTSDFAGGVPTHCFDRLSDTAGMVPIKDYKLYIDEFEPDQKFVVRFKTWRCCADDNEFNTGVDFNRWRLPVTYRDCHTTYPANTGLPNTSWLDDSYVGDTGQVTQTYRAFNYYNESNAAISSNSYDADNYDDLELIQDFQQDVTDLTGQGGGGCGASEHFSIENITFNTQGGSDYDTQLFCDTSTSGGLAGVTGLHPQGQFKVEFNCDSGVTLDIAHLPYISKGASIWYPTLFNTTAIPPYAIFDIDSMPGGNNSTSYLVRTFISGSSFNFWLMGCCPIHNPTPLVTVNTLFNPQIYGHGCDSCFIPLSQIQFNIQLHCPGCVTPGLILADSKLNRISFGYRDTDDDGIADGSGPSSIGAGYTPYDSAWINAGASIVGDTLEGIAHAFFEDGDPADGFSYAGWQAYWDIADAAHAPHHLTDIYFEQGISNVGDSILQCIGATLYYRSAGSGADSAYTLPGISPSTPGSPNTSGRLLFHVPVDSIPGSAVIQPYDSFQMRITYVVCKNPSSELALQVTNYMYLSVDTLSQAYPFQQGTPEVGDVYGDADSIQYAMDSTHIGPSGYDPSNEALFICKGHGSAHYIYRVKTAYAETWDNSPPDCGKSASVTASYYVDGSHRNIFPYEFRLMPRIDAADCFSGPLLADSLPVLFHFTLPQGYRAIPARTYTELYTYINAIQNMQVATAATTSQIDTPASITGPYNYSYRLDLGASHYVPATESGLLNVTYNPSPPNSPPAMNYALQQSTGDTVLLIGDERFTQVMVWNITPICSTALQPQDTINPEDVYAVIPEIDNRCSGFQPDDTLNNTSSFTLSIPNPTINASTLTPLFYGADADFPIRMEVNPGQVSNLIYYMDVSAGALPSGVTAGCLSSGPGCSGNNYNQTTIITGTDTFTRYTLGQLGHPSATTDTFYLHIFFSNCDSINKTLHIPVYYFWSCDEVAGDLPPTANLCDIPDTLLINYTMPNVTFNLSQTAPSTPYSTCTDLIYKIKLGVSSEGGMGNFTAATVLPEHVTVVSAAIDTSLGGSYSTSIPISHQSLITGDTLWGFDMSGWTAFDDTSWVGVNGLNNDDGGGICLQVILSADCHLTALDSVKVVLDGDLYCGETYRAYAAKISDPLFPDSLVYTFNPLGALANGCGPYVTAELANAPCYGPVDFTTSLGTYGVGPLDTLWQPATPGFSAPDTGTYYVTVTDSNGCEDKDTVQILPAFDPTMAINGNPCQVDTPVLLYVDSLPPGFTGTYSWNTGSTFDTTQVLLDVGQYYDVTVTDANGCEEIGQRKFELVGVGSLPHYSGCEIQDTLSLVGNPPYSFEWEDSLGDTISVISINATGSPDTFLLHVPSELFYSNSYLHITDANGCLGAILIKDSCGFDQSCMFCCFSSQNADVTRIGYDTLSSKLSVTAGDFIYISDSVTLTIDSSFTLQNCEVVLGADAKIVVENGAAFNILGSYLHGCKAMWDGIYVEAEGNLTVDSSGGQRSRVEDAMTGLITYYNEAQFRIKHTDFKRNQRNVVFYFYEPGADTSYSISDCYFGMGAYTAMLPVPPGYDSSSHPLSGIEVRYCYSDTLRIPNPATGDEASTFEDMNTGIYMYASWLKIGESYFRRIRNYEDNHTYANAFNSARGAAIYGNGAYYWWDNTLQVFTQSNVPSDTTVPRFKQCDYGILAVRLKVNAVRNRMDSVTSCIKVMNGYAKVWVSDNCLTHTNYGITLNNNAGAWQKVWNNTIDVNPPVSQFVLTDDGIAIELLNTYGISEAEIDNQVPVNSSIYTNHITGGRNCIALNNANSAQLYQNELYQTGNTAVAGTQAGIYAANSLDLNITLNSAVGNGADYCDQLSAGGCTVNSAYRKSGYSFYGSTGEFCSNSADSLGYASFFAANCNDMSVRKNTYGKSKFAMVLRSSGNSEVLGDQGYDSLSLGVDHGEEHGNEFAGDGSSSHTFANDSSFRTYSFINISVDSVYRPPVLYFADSANASNVQYPDPSGATINGQTGGVTNNLYAVKSAPMLSTTITSYACDWLSLPLVTPWDQLVAGGHGHEHMETGYGETGERLAAQRLFDKLRADTALLEADTLLSGFYADNNDAIIGKISDYRWTLRELNDSATVGDSLAFTDKLEEAAELNGRLYGYTDQLTTNFDSIHSLYLNLLGSPADGFDSATLSLLRSMAAQCPYVAGEAVYAARTLLAQADDRAFYDDVALCETIEESGKWENEQSGNSRTDTLPVRREFVKVFPNPANDRLHVLFEAKVAGQAKFELLTLTGRMLKTVDIQEQTNYATFEIKDLPAGMYMWRLRDRVRAIASGMVGINR